MADPRVSAVLLAYGHQPLFLDAVDAVLASSEIDVDVVVVDNGGEPATIAAAQERGRVRVVTPGANLGFAAGCNLGAREAAGEFLALVNGDALVDADALRHLVETVETLDPEGREVAMASASVRLLDAPDTINSAGNPVHFLGLSWAGGMGRPATAYAEPQAITSATGATAVVRRSRFLEVGGFNETLFTYYEDTELSLRLWQRGMSVRYVPAAVVRHDYEFGRNPGKFYLLERNRLFTVLTLYPARVLTVVAPVLLAFELAVLALALKDGWSREKLRGWWWLLRHAGAVRRRRRELGALRVVDDREFAALLTSTLDPGVEGLSVPAAAQSLLTLWWRLARRLV